MSKTPNDYVKVCENIRNLILFKKSVIQLTTDEITNLEKELDYVQNKATEGDAYSVNPPDYATT